MHVDWDKKNPRAYHLISFCVFRHRMTQIPAEVREDYLHELSRVFTPEAYHLFHNNCNTFSNEFSTFLTGNGIPVCDPTTPPLPYLPRSFSTPEC